MNDPLLKLADTPPTAVTSDTSTLDAVQTMIQARVGAVAVIAFVVYLERAQRRIVVQYPKRQVGQKMYGGENSHLPLKVNTAGVIPPIFASSLLLMPTTIAGFSGDGGSEWMQIVLAKVTISVFQVMMMVQTRATTTVTTWGALLRSRSRKARFSNH